jgi:hypothetical protein
LEFAVSNNRAASLEAATRKVFGGESVEMSATAFPIRTSVLNPPSPNAPRLEGRPAVTELPDTGREEIAPLSASNLRGSADKSARIGRHEIVPDRVVPDRAIRNSCKLTGQPFVHPRSV